MAPRSVPDDAATPPPRDPAKKSIGSRTRALGVGVWKYLAGVVACQSAFFCVLANGWTYRLAQRSVLKRWWKMSDRRGESSFNQFVRDASRERDRVGTVLASHRQWPNWILAQPFVETARGRAAGRGGLRKVAAGLKALVGSLWLNLKIGVQGILNTWVLTLPGCALWATAWFGGWNNSFNKGYELAAVGPVTGLLGVGLFILAMLFLPMAQARQAATGEWRTFYEFRLLRRLVALRWRSCFVLALLYSLASFPLTILLVLPAFFLQMWPDLALLSSAEALQFLTRYYFWVSMAAFPVFVFLRLAAARVYGTGIVKMIRARAIGIEELAPVERDVLARMRLDQAAPEREHNIVLRVAGQTAFRTGRIGARALVLAIWFAFVAQIFIGQFFFYRPYQGWLNQPLVQLPYIPHLPAHLRIAAEEEAEEGAEEPAADS